MDWMPQAVRDGIVVVLLISGPLVLTAAFIGLTIGVLQAATQVQEQTIGSALKIIGVFALIMFAGFWMYQYLSNYTSRTISSAFNFVPKQTQKVVPPNAFEGGDESISFDEEKGKPEVIEPEKLELPEDTVPPPGAPLLGAPKIPQAPEITKISPPSIPGIPKPSIMPVLPLSDFQEPKTIPIEEPQMDEVQQNEIPKDEMLEPEESVEQNAGQNEEETQNNEILMDNGSQEAGSPSWLN